MSKNILRVFYFILFEEIFLTFKNGSSCLIISILFTNFIYVTLEKILISIFLFYLRLSLILFLLFFFIYIYSAKFISSKDCFQYPINFILFFAHVIIKMIKTSIFSLYYKYTFSLYYNIYKYKLKIYRNKYLFNSIIFKFIFM